MRRRKNFTDLTGQRFGLYIVIRRLEPIPYACGSRATRWECKCDCGNIREVNQCNLVSTKNPNCGCVRSQTSSRLFSKTIGDLCGAYWCWVRRSAKTRNLELLITQQYAWEVFCNQNGKCAITGMPITLDPLLGRKRYYRIKHNQTASLDRIDSSKGYIEGNIQWVHWAINLMKLDWTMEEFIEWCRLVAENNPRESEIPSAKA